MKKRVGFTLVELLAVIAILAILVIIALPNVMGMFNSAKKSTFLTEIKKIYRGAEQEYVKDSFTTSGNKIYAKAKDKCSKELDMSIRDDLEYFIEINSSGKVIRFYAHDNSYQYEHEGEMTINDITDAEDVSQTSEKIAISCDNVDFVEQNVLARFIPGSEINIRMKTLAGNTNPTNETINENITAIIKSDTQPSEENKQSINIVSTSDSTKPIYMWYDSGTIYYYSEENPSLNKDSSNAFRYLTKLSDISGLSNFDTSHVRNFERLFYGCSSIKNLEPIKNWNTSKVTNMLATFGGKQKYTMHIKSLKPLSKWNTSKVTSMSGMFQDNVDLESLEGLENWDTSNVTNMLGMFLHYQNGLSKLKDISALKNWNTSKVTNMRAMFQENVSLESLEGLENWDTSNVTNMISMFLGTSEYSMHIKSLKPLSRWNTSNVTAMNSMFQGNIDLENLEGLENWNTSKVTNMSSMFEFNESLTSLDGLENWNTSNVTDMSFMFNGSIDKNRPMHIKSIEPLSKWNVSKVTSFSEFLDYNVDLVSTKGLENWNTSSAINFSSMIRECTNLEYADLSGLDLSNAKIYTDSEGKVFDLIKMIGNDKKIKTIKTPKAFPIDTNLYIELPIKMYDSEGNAYTRLDNTTPKQIELYSVNPKG